MSVSRYLGWLIICFWAITSRSRFPAGLRSITSFFVSLPLASMVLTPRNVGCLRRKHNISEYIEILVAAVFEPPTFRL